MYIMRRRATVKGLAGLDHAQKVTGVVQDAGIPVALWVGGPGTTPGTVAWTVPVESLAEWGALNQKLMADAAYQSASMAGQDLIESFEVDELHQIMHGEQARPSQVGDVVSGVTASIAAGQGEKATAFAAEIAVAWSDVTGISAFVTTHAMGPMATVNWFVVHDDLESVDMANAKIAASETYAATLAKGDGLFTDGSTAIARRVA